MRSRSSSERAAVCSRSHASASAKPLAWCPMRSIDRGMTTAGYRDRSLRTSAGSAVPTRATAPSSSPGGRIRSGRACSETKPHARLTGTPRLPRLVMILTNEESVAK